VTTLASNYDYADGIAVDGSGNVYVAGGGAIKEFVAVNGSIPANPAINILGSGFSVPFGVAVDGSGNVYVADWNNNAIKEMMAVNGRIPANPTINILGSGFSYPQGVAVDGSGNVYVADQSQSAVKEMVAVNGRIPANPTINTLGTGFFYPWGVAVDGSGNVYVGDRYNSSVKEILAVNGSIPADPTINQLFSGGYPEGVAVGGGGNIYIADTDNYQVVEIDLADPPSLSFAPTRPGSTSDPQSVTVGNFGNATLVGTSLSVSANWSQVAASGTPPDCASSFSLAHGAECNLGISFEPTEAAALTGTATLTDNAFNAVGATQEIPLSGTGEYGQLSVSPATLAFGNLALGQQEDKSLQIINTGSVPVPLTLTINGPSFTIPPLESECPTVLPASNGCILYVRFLPRTYGGHGDTLTLAAPEDKAPTVHLTAQTLGVGAELGLLNFGTIPNGTTTILNVPIVNYGVTKNVTFSTSINGSNFKVLTASNTCLSGLTAAQQCTIPVEFSPAAVGAYANVLTITASSGDVSTVKLSGTASQP
jgi:sugar lactone lactonase YvrE